MIRIVLTFLAGCLFLALAIGGSPDEQYAVLAVLAICVALYVVAWLRHRRHSTEGGESR